MSTKIKDTYPHYGPHELIGDSGNVIFGAERVSHGQHLSVTANVPRAEFLAAVAVECGVVIIDRTDLPVVKATEFEAKVEVAEGHQGDWKVTPGETPAAAVRKDAVALLALAEYLDANPPVDEAQVEALAALLWEYAQNPSGPGDTFEETTDAERNRCRNRAGRLLSTGRIEVKP